MKCYDCCQTVKDEEVEWTPRLKLRLCAKCQELHPDLDYYEDQAEANGAKPNFFIHPVFGEVIGYRNAKEFDEANKQWMDNL